MTWESALIISAISIFTVPITTLLTLFVKRKYRFRRVRAFASKDFSSSTKWKEILEYLSPYRNNNMSEFKTYKNLDYSWTIDIEKTTQFTKYNEDIIDDLRESWIILKTVRYDTNTYILIPKVKGIPKWIKSIH